MSPSEAARLTALAEQFMLAAPVRRVEPFGTGLINRTYLVTTSGPRYVLQRLNDQVFPEPAAILANLARLTAHRLRHPAAGLRLPRLIPGRCGRLGIDDEAGALWRMLDFLGDTEVVTHLATMEQAFTVGTLVGRFHRLCSDLDPSDFAIALPDFHATPLYMARLEQVVADIDPTTQPATVQSALSFVAERRALADALEGPRAAGRVPMRIVHGDPKLDNLLFDQRGQRAIGLVDLDTLQPGLIPHDIGDLLRSVCNPRRESDREARFDIDLCAAVLDAYAAETKPFLAEAEIALIAPAIRLLPLELGVRFLTDHLEGDRYFRVRRPGDNLDRAMAQFSLVADIETKAATLRRVIAAAFGVGG
ncbi:aminoglycoside phosphotransferase family protein [Thioalkalicoccus limnaeus]|uniref:Aminoglycoside phosphotransferase family protein n=1 Tax=Thioalkalicoccus limnaeus TaxID=120681 RepID=A0ABV4BG33_9GAMM